MNPLESALRAIGRYAFVWLAFAAVSLVNWMQETFGEVTLGQILFHWRHLGATGSIEKVAANELLVQCVLWPFVGAALFVWIECRLLSPILERLPPQSRARASRAVLALPSLVIMGCVTTFAWRTSALQFLWPSSDKGYFAMHYSPPSAPTPVGHKTKNLVLIYVESLETAYGRPDLFRRDLIASLNALRPLTFESYEQLPGTGYTIAAIVSTQCGVPLQMVGFLDWKQQGEKAQQFLPRAVCLGDILHAAGYRNVFMGGAALEFSGKGKFVSQHHFDETYGRVEWLNLGIPKSRMSGWGLHDDDLFTQAKSKIRQLHEAGQPFSLTLLTVDSHHPAGYLSAGCIRRGAKALDEIVECTSQMVAELVTYVRESGYDEDTNIVVLGDHLSPPNTLASALNKAGKRTIYNAFFAREQPKPNRSAVVHFDMLPTILEFIGMRPEQGRAGLGFSAFGAPPVPFPTARSRQELGEHSLTPSPAYLELWEPGHLHENAPAIVPAAKPY